MWWPARHQGDGRGSMKRPETSPDLFSHARVPLQSPAPPAELATVVPFEFEHGAECEPRPGWVVPEWLRLPTDDPEWLPEVWRND